MKRVRSCSSEGIRSGAFALLSAVAVLAATDLFAVDVPRFIGGKSYVNLGTPDALQRPAMAPFTLEAWVRVEQKTDTAMIFSKNAGRSSPYTFMFGLRGFGAKMSAYTGAGGSPANTWREAALPEPIMTGEWRHLAYRYDGTNLAFICDGVLIGSAAYSYGFYDTHTVKIGGYADNNSDLQGNIADVRFWDHARSAAQIAAHRGRRLLGNEPGLLGYWPLDEGSGSEVFDRTDNAGTGTLETATWVTEDALAFTDFAVAHPVTGGARFCGTNELAVAGLSIPDGCDYYQITTSGLAAAISPGGWISTSVPPVNVTFDRPAADTNVTLYAWFTNSVSGTRLHRDEASIFYTTVAPTVAVRPTLTRERLPGHPVVIQGGFLDNGSTGGEADGTVLAVAAYRALAANPEDDQTPESPYVTLVGEGTYPLRLRVMNEAGQVATGVETCLVTVASYSGTNLWTGNGLTDRWLDGGNWSAGIPAAGQNVAIRGGNGCRLTEATPELNHFELTGGSLVFAGWEAPLRATNVTIRGGTVACAGDCFEAGSSNRVWIVAEDDFMLVTPGQIDVGGQGFKSMSGPGTGIASAYGTGGGHGGRGGASYLRGGGVCGNLRQPELPGSGGTPYSWLTKPGGSGGGVVRIQAGGTADIRGTIAANGATMSGAGGGAGGSIYITAAHFSGSTDGLLSVKGGDEGYNRYGGGGGGGRIALDGGTVASPFLVRFSAAPGISDKDTGDANELPADIRRLDSNHAWNPGWGTLYVADEILYGQKPAANQYDRIERQIGEVSSWTVDALCLTNNSFRLLPQGFQLNVEGDLILGANAHLGVKGSVACGGNLVLTNGGRLSVYSGPASGGLYGASVEVTNDIVIAEDSWLQPHSDPTDGASVRLRMRNLLVIGVNAGINAMARGYAPWQGPGHGYGTSYYGTGGGYGGMGGKTGYGAAGAVYGNPYAPLAPGSGGGSSADGAPLFTGSGYGGGLISIEARGDVRTRGQLHAAGGLGWGHYLYGAGGAGGGIFIDCNRFVGEETALLSVKGGDSPRGGGGGGGRIAVWHKRMPPYLQEKLLAGETGSAVASTNAPAGYLGEVDIGIGTGNDNPDAQPGTVWFIAPPPMGTYLILMFL